MEEEDSADKVLIDVVTIIVTNAGDRIQFEKFAKDQFDLGVNRALERVKTSGRQQSGVLYGEILRVHENFCEAVDKFVVSNEENLYFVDKVAGKRHKQSLKSDLWAILVKHGHEFNQQHIGEQQIEVASSSSSSSCLLVASSSPSTQERGNPSESPLGVYHSALMYNAEVAHSVGLPGVPRGQPMEAPVIGCPLEAIIIGFVMNNQKKGTLLLECSRTLLKEVLVPSLRRSAVSWASSNMSILFDALLDDEEEKQGCLRINSDLLDPQICVSIWAITVISYLLDMPIGVYRSNSLKNWVTYTKVAPLPAEYGQRLTKLEPHFEFEEKLKECWPEFLAESLTTSTSSSAIVLTLQLEMMPGCVGNSYTDRIDSGVLLLLKKQSPDEEDQEQKITLVQKLGFEVAERSNVSSRVISVHSKLAKTQIGYDELDVKYEVDSDDFQKKCGLNSTLASLVLALRFYFTGVTEISKDDNAISPPAASTPPTAIELADAVKKGVLAYAGRHAHDLLKVFKPGGSFNGVLPEDITVEVFLTLLELGDVGRGGEAVFLITFGFFFNFNICCFFERTFDVDNESFISRGRVLTETIRNEFATDDKDEAALADFCSILRIEPDRQQQLIGFTFLITSSISGGYACVSSPLWSLLRENLVVSLLIVHDCIDNLSGSVTSIDPQHEVVGVSEGVIAKVASPGYGDEQVLLLRKPRFYRSLTKETTGEEQKEEVEVEEDDEEKKKGSKKAIITANSRGSAVKQQQLAPLRQPRSNNSKDNVAAVSAAPVSARSGVRLRTPTIFLTTGGGRDGSELVSLHRRELAFGLRQSFQDHAGSQGSTLRRKKKASRSEEEAVVDNPPPKKLKTQGLKKHANVEDEDREEDDVGGGVVEGIGGYRFMRNGLHQFLVLFEERDPSKNVASIASDDNNWLNAKDLQNISVFYEFLEKIRDREFDLVVPSEHVDILTGGAVCDAEVWITNVFPEGDLAPSLFLDQASIEHGEMLIDNDLFDEALSVKLILLKAFDAAVNAAGNACATDATTSVVDIICDHMVKDTTNYWKTVISEEAERKSQVICVVRTEHDGSLYSLEMSNSVAFIDILYSDDLWEKYQGFSFPALGSEGDSILKLCREGEGGKLQQVSRQDVGEDTLAELWTCFIQEDYVCARQGDGAKDKQMVEMRKGVLLTQDWVQTLFKNV